MNTYVLTENELRELINKALDLGWSEEQREFEVDQLLEDYRYCQIPDKHSRMD